MDIRITAQWLTQHCIFGNDSPVENRNRESICTPWVHLVRKDSSASRQKLPGLPKKCLYTGLFTCSKKDKNKRNILLTQIGKGERTDIDGMLYWYLYQYCYWPRTGQTFMYYLTMRQCPQEMNYHGLFELSLESKRRISFHWNACLHKDRCNVQCHQKSAGSPSSTYPWEWYFLKKLDLAVPACCMSFRKMIAL